MIDSLTDMSMEGTFTIEEADLKKLQEVLCDIKIEECPWFEVHDKYGSSAKYYRDGLIDTKAEGLSNNLPKVDSDSGELISRQVTLDALDEIESEVADGEGFQYEKWRRYFCDLPPAQSGIVLCKECSHRDEDGACDQYNDGTVAVSSYVPDEHFCSWGERKVVL